MRFTSLGLGVLLAALTAGPVAASPTATYHGYLTGATFTCDGRPAAGPELTGEVWNLTVKGDTAALSINVHYDGKHHASFRVPGGAIAAGPGIVADFWGGYGDGGGTATITGSVFTWSVYLGYDCTPEAGYDALTYIGTLGR